MINERRVPREATDPTAAYQAIVRIRRHSRACRGIETRRLLLAIERRMLELADL